MTKQGEMAKQADQSYGDESSAIRLAAIPLSGALPGLPRMLLPAIATMLRGRRRAWPADSMAARYRLEPPGAGHISAYNRIIEGPGTATPLTYFYLMAQRAQVALMLDSRYPYAVPGMIHISNDMALKGAFSRSQPLELTVRAQELRDEVGPGRSVLFQVDIVQTKRVIATCSSTYRVRQAGGKLPRPPAADTAAIPDEAPMERWYFDATIGRRYARVSGDYNPIHLSPMLARLFGFDRAIAHGMYSVGRAMAAIEVRTGRRVETVTARFERAIKLPSAVNLWWHPSQAGVSEGRYALESVDYRVFVSGSYELI